MTSALKEEFHGSQFLMRWVGPPIIERRQIHTADDALMIWRDFVASAEWFDGSKEMMVLIALNMHNDFIGWHLVGIGSCNGVEACPREILRAALRMDAYFIILAHNHPSGRLVPSEPDVKVTRMVATACRGVRLSLHDHLVVNSEGTEAVSLLDHDPTLFQPETSRPPESSATLSPARLDAVSVEIPLPTRFSKSYTGSNVQKVLAQVIRGEKAEEWVRLWKNAPYLRRYAKQLKSAKRLETIRIMLIGSDFDEVSRAAESIGLQPEFFLASLLVDREPFIEGWKMGGVERVPNEVSPPENILQFKK